MLNNKKAFTIVELVVVITILAILGTIGFISYSSYLIYVRDANRYSQLSSINEGLNTLKIKGKIPIPDDVVEIQYSGSIVAYQGIIGSNILSIMDYSNSGLDPKDNKEYSYYITKNRKYFQLMGFLEKESNLMSSMVNNTYATDYEERTTFVMGNKLGILTTDTNQPVAEYLLSASLTSIDIFDVSNQPLKSYLTSTEYVEGTGTTFAELKNVAKIGGKYYSVVGNTFNYNPPVY